jgi:hypothetical protein
MAPSFTLISGPNTKIISAVVTNTLQKYYPLFVDGVNFTLDLFLRKYKGSNSRLFKYEEGEWIMFKLEDEQVPNLILTFDTDKVVSESEWELAHKWLNQLFSGEEDYDMLEDIKTLIPQYTNCEEKLSPSKYLEPLPKQNDAYMFRYLIDLELDQAFFEVTKPNTDKPYLAVIRQYEKRGMLPFFTALYVCSSWGVCNYDHLFLNKIWTHLDLDKQHGDLDLENRLKADIAKCLPDNPGGPEAEPEVYRMTIEELIDMWSNKRKNQDFVDTAQVKKKQIKYLF